MSIYKRRQSCPVNVGPLTIGGTAPVVVQSMTNTSTEDIPGTVKQIIDLVNAGSEIVRITVNTKAAAACVAKIVDELNKKSINVPLVGDFHYNGHLLLAEYPDCAQALAKYRINPGNVGKGERHDTNFKTMIEAAIKWQKPVRIGVNWGSLDQDLLAEMMDANAKSSQPAESGAVLTQAIVESALRSAKLAEEYGLAHNQIILSAKVSIVNDLITVYRQLAAHCDYPLHLGLTEAGMSSKGIVSTTAALSILLSQGIGDTIRASLTPEPGGDRTIEVTVCQQILQALGLRSFSASVTACPGCGRTTSTVFQELAQDIENHLTERRKIWQEKYPGFEELKVAVMGCIVNGPGESKHADIGISLPGVGEEPKAPVFINGEYFNTLAGPTLAQDFIALVDNYVEERFSQTAIELVRQ